MPLANATVQPRGKGGQPVLGPLLFFFLLLVAGFPAPALAYRSIPDEIKRGMDLAFERRYADAIEVLSSALKRYPDSPEGHFYLALSQYSSDMPLEAASEWEKTLTLDPAFPQVRVNLALAYYDAGDLVLAEKNARLAVAKNPRNHVSHLVLGRALRDQLRLEEALRELSRARDLSPELSGIHAELGELNQDLGRSREALEEFREAVTLSPDDSTFRFLLGLAYLKDEKDDLAEKEFSEAIRLDPQNAPSYYNLGLVYLRKRSDSGVLAMIDVLKTRNPAWAEELANALTLQAGQGKAAGSTETLSFVPRLVRGFTFASEFSRKGNLSFHHLEDSEEERHEYLLSQKVRWEVQGGGGGAGFRVACRQEEAISSLDGKPLPDPLLADLDHAGVFLSLDSAGRILSITRGEEAVPPAAARHIRRLWSNSFLGRAPSTLAVGSSWILQRDVEIPLAGWRTLAARFSVESFEPSPPGEEGVRSARLLLLIPPGGEAISAEEGAAPAGTESAAANPAGPRDENPAKDLRGEGRFYLNPLGGWMSSVRVLYTGSLVVAVEGKNSQVQFSIQESQSNR